MTTIEIEGVEWAKECSAVIRNEQAITYIPDHPVYGRCVLIQKHGNVADIVVPWHAVDNIHVKKGTGL